MYELFCVWSGRGGEMCLHSQRLKDGTKNTCIFKFKPLKCPLPKVNIENTLRIIESWSWK